jgi:hypothetical protein
MLSDYERTPYNFFIQGANSKKSLLLLKFKIPQLLTHDSLTTFTFHLSKQSKHILSAIIKVGICNPSTVVVC